MVQVQGISSFNNNRKRSVINAKNTGYTAVAGMGMAIASGYSKNKTFRKGHKFFAGISLAAVLAHIYLVSAKHKSPKPDCNFLK